jgi:hypothetical protein
MNNSRIFLGAIIIIFGVSILFNIDIIRILFPLLLIWLGIRIIGGKTSSPFLTKSESHEGKIKHVAIFSEMNQKVQHDNLEEGEIIAILGGGNIDLSAVKTKNKRVKLDLVAILGGIKVTLPPNWSVRSEGVGILGGFNNNAGTDVKKTVEVEVKGVAILGGVYIVN